LYEYFVAGIKTNISLFQRILSDADFQAGRLDTGYLDRLLAKSNPAMPPKAAEAETGELEAIAAIAAGMFTVLDPASTPGSNGDASRADSGGTTATPSQWKRQARAEGLR